MSSLTMNPEQFNEQFNKFSKSAVDVLARFSRVPFDSAERYFALNLSVANGAKEIENVPEFMTDYLKSLYDIGATAQAQYTTLLQEQVSAFQNSLVEGIDKAASTAPAGSEKVFAALKSGVAASTAALETLSAVSRQATSFAEDAVKSATSDATSAATSAATKARKNR